MTPSSDDAVPAAASPRADVRVACTTAAEAEALRAALAPENAGFLDARVVGTTLVMSAEARSIASLRATLDDALACLSVAQRAQRVADGA